MKKEYTNKENNGVKPMLNNVLWQSIWTTCKCGKTIQLIDNGQWHNYDCECGFNTRMKGGTMIVERIRKPQNCI